MDDANFFSFTPFDFNGGYEKEEAAKQDLCPSAVQDRQNVNHHLPLELFYQQVNNKIKNFEDDQQQQQQQQSKSNYMDLDDLDPPGPSAKRVSQQENISQQLIICSSRPNTPSGSDIKQMQIPSLSSFGLLSNYGNLGLKKLKEDKKSSKISMSRIYVSRKKSSTEEIIRVAGARYIQFFNRYCYDDPSGIPMHPFGYALSGLSGEEIKDVELAHLLLAAAEKVGYEQFVTASRLLLRCEWVASSRGNPVQRIVFYFAEALRARIEKKTGRSMMNNTRLEKGGCANQPTISIPFVKCYQSIPFLQSLMFAAVQTILENVGAGAKVHLIDLEIRSGVHWMVLMEALAGRVENRIHHLKITAVGTTGNQMIEETRNRLISVAESLGLPFEFKAVYVTDMDEIREEMLEMEDEDEALIVYSALALRTMLWRPRCLENLMRVIRNLCPSMMVIIEVEANHNSTSFVNRFIEALFFYGAFFDCLENCVKEEESRNAVESMLGVGIRDIVANDGSERVTRNVKVEVWRAFFGRFKMTETKLSDGAMYQASLMAKRFGGGNSCTLDRNAKCLIIGWKGTPIHSLSVWKFL